MKYFILVIFIFLGCGDQNLSEEILGKWNTSNDFDLSLEITKLTFEEKSSRDTIKWSYQIIGDTLILKSRGIVRGHIIEYLTHENLSFRSLDIHQTDVPLIDAAHFHKE